jgi:hypothetical protein
MTLLITFISNSHAQQKEKRKEKEKHSFRTQFSSKKVLYIPSYAQINF